MQLEAAQQLILPSKHLVSLIRNSEMGRGEVGKFLGSPEESSLSICHHSLDCGVLLFPIYF